jgi:hypothetical protein
MGKFEKPLKEGIIKEIKTSLKSLDLDLLGKYYNDGSLLKAFMNKKTISMFT